MNKSSFKSEKNGSERDTCKIFPRNDNTHAYHCYNSL